MFGFIHPSKVKKISDEAMSQIPKSRLAKVEPTHIETPASPDPPTEPVNGGEEITVMAVLSRLSAVAPMLVEHLLPEINSIFAE